MSENLYQEYFLDEMINGQILFVPPHPTVNHNRVCGNIFRAFGNRLEGKGCEAFGGRTDVYLSEKDRVIPDVMIICNENIIKEMGIYGVPDLVVEVLSPGTEKRDRVLIDILFDDPLVKLNSAIIDYNHCQWQGLRRHKCPIDNDFVYETRQSSRA